MAQITSFKKMAGILYYSLLLLTFEGIYGESPINAMVLRNNHTLSQQQREVMQSLLVPIPIIITGLNNLTDNSTDQFDSALSWAADVTNKTESLKDIDYSQGVQTILQEISLYLTKSLGTTKKNAEKIALLITSSNFGSFQRYLTNYQQETNPFVDLVPLSLNQLKNLSDNIVFLSSQSPSEFHKVANLTKTLFATLKVIQSTKLQTTDNKSNDIENIRNRKNELEKEISSLSEKQERFIHNATQWESHYYTSLNRFVNVVKKQRDAKLRNCLVSFVKTLNDSMTGDVIIKCPGSKPSNEIKSTLPVAKNAKMSWVLVIKLLNETKEELKLKREEHKQLSDQIQTHTSIRNSQMDLDLLNSTANSIAQLGKEMDKLAVGWNNLTNYCLNIRSDISTIKNTLLHSNTTIDTRALRSIEGLLSKVNEQWRTTHEDIRSVGKMAEEYVNSYSSDLASLVVQLERKVTKSDEE